MHKQSFMIASRAYTCSLTNNRSLDCSSPSFGPCRSHFSYEYYYTGIRDLFASKSGSVRTLSDRLKRYQKAVAALAA